MDLSLGIADGIDDLEDSPSMELAVLGIDVDLELLTGVNPLLGRGFKRVGDGRNHVRAANALFLLHVFQDG